MPKAKDEEKTAPGTPKGDLFSVEGIAKLLQVLKANDVNEFQLDQGEFKLSLHRETRGELLLKSANTASAEYAASQQQFNAALAPNVSNSADEKNNSNVAAAVAEAKSSFHEIKSPMVGTFYRKPSPDAPPYVEVGDIVKKGQVLCIIEAMKVMNEINADKSGRIVEVCLEDAQMAEFNEVLFRIDSNAL